MRWHVFLVCPFPGELLRKISPADVSHALNEPRSFHAIAFFVVGVVAALVVVVFKVVVGVVVVATVGAADGGITSLIEIKSGLFFMVAHNVLKWPHHPFLKRVIL